MEETLGAGHKEGLRGPKGQETGHREHEGSALRVLRRPDMTLSPKQTLTKTSDPVCGLACGCSEQATTSGCPCQKQDLHKRMLLNLTHRTGQGLPSRF